MKTILEIKGAKRFKKQNNNAGQMTHEDMLTAYTQGKTFDLAKSKDILRSMNNKSSYNTQFGERPKGTEDYLVCKYKKFRTLEISNYIQP
jgi:hypothetical protein